MKYLISCASALVIAAGLAVPSASAQTGGKSKTLDAIKARGSLSCGVNTGLAGFSMPDKGKWSGIDVDICRALAAAIFNDPNKIKFIPLTAKDRFTALQTGEIDVLSRNGTWTMTREADLGLMWAGVNYYDGQGFLAHAVDGMSSALELNGARICVVTGTTTEDNAAEYFANNGMEVTFLRFADRGEARKAYAAGDCDVYTADSSALAAERSLLEVPDDHVLLREVISKEPLGPVTRESDPQWTELVRWVLYGLINAEEAELTAASVDEKTGDPAKRQKAMQFGAPGVKEFGLADDWLIVVLDAVGNYGDIFERNLGEDTPLALRRGVNALWTQGGILYAPPMH